MLSLLVPSLSRTVARLVLSTRSDLRLGETDVALVREAFRSVVLVVLVVDDFRVIRSRPVTFDILIRRSTPIRDAKP